MLLPDLATGASGFIWPWIAIGVAGLILTSMAVSHVRKEAKIRLHGGHAPRFGGWLPFGTTPHEIAS
jgi:hypothetical protein